MLLIFRSKQFQLFLYTRKNQHQIIKLQSFVNVRLFAQLFTIRQLHFTGEMSNANNMLDASYRSLLSFGELEVSKGKCEFFH